MEMPFPDERFDAVFSGGSLHEWEDPLRVLNEIHRVLKTGGRYCICDLRRDLPFFIKWLFSVSVKPASIRHGLTTSLQASYTKSELEKIVACSHLNKATVNVNVFGISIVGMK